MAPRFPPEPITEVLPLLPSVARLVARGSTVDADHCEVLLTAAGVEPGQESVAELVLWARLLGHVSTDGTNRDVVREGLVLRGIPDDQAQSALDVLVGTAQPDSTPEDALPESEPPASDADPAESGLEALAAVLLPTANPNALSLGKMAMSGDGRVCVIDGRRQVVHVLAPDLRFLETWGPFGAADGTGQGLTAIAPSAHGGIWLAGWGLQPDPPSPMFTQILHLSPRGQIICRYSPSEVMGEVTGLGQLTQTLLCFAVSYGRLSWMNVARDGSVRPLPPKDTQGLDAATIPLTGPARYAGHRLVDMAVAGGPTIFLAFPGQITGGSPRGDTRGEPWSVAWEVPHGEKGPLAISGGGADILVADTTNAVVYMLSFSEDAWGILGGPGTQIGSFSHPTGVAVGADCIYVADAGNNRVQKLDLADDAETHIWTTASISTFR